MLHLAFDIEDLVELRKERRLIHPFLFRQRQERGGFAFQLHPQFIGTRLCLLHTGADCFQLLWAQSDAVLCQEHKFRWKKCPGERVGGLLGLVRREQRIERSEEDKNSDAFYGMCFHCVCGCGVGLHCRKDHCGMRGSSSSESVGDAHGGNNVGGSMESRAIWLCVELIAVATSGRGREGLRVATSIPINTNTAQAAAAANEPQPSNS